MLQLLEEVHVERVRGHRQREQIRAPSEKIAARWEQARRLRRPRYVGQLCDVCVAYGQYLQAGLISTHLRNVE
jgi:hypothetical protein